MTTVRDERWCWGLLGMCVVAGAPGMARAQEGLRLDRVVVEGLRSSAETAQQRKRESADIVDSVIAAEIHKLADLSVADALQRVTGVQVARDRGEASAFAVRGLTQVETTLNGREVFTAGAGRTVDLADFASEMLAGIDIYKTASAERLEGGLGGSIDLRTRRPFDFAGDTTVLSARTARADLAARSAGQASALISRRVRDAQAGEFGLLVNLAFQERAWREDQKNTGAPALRNDLLPDGPVVAPGGTTETVSLGTRRRLAGSALLQWRPVPNFEVLAEAHLAELRTRQDSHQINASAGTGVVPGSLALFDGTRDLRSITWTDAPVSVLGFARDTLDRTRQFALAARHDGEVWTWSADLSHTRSRNELLFSGPFLATRVAQFHQDFGGTVPATSIVGTDLLDPANWRYTGLAYRKRPFEGSLAALRLDGERALQAGPLERLALGWRRADRRADNAPGLVFGDVGVSGLTAADLAGRVRPTPFGDFLDGQAGSIGSFLIADLGDARDPAALRDAFGIATPLPTAGSALGVWSIRERSDAAYLRSDWAVPSWQLDTRWGVRVVRTRSWLDGTRSAPDTGGLLPLSADTTATDWLPSASLRQRFAQGWQWRAAASRTITRPNFDQLSPSLSLLRNSLDPTLNQGAAGNPELQPVRSTNLDLALERLDDAHGGYAVTVFRKNVVGFVATASRPEVYDGVSYQVSRPYNSDPARVRGLELAWQRFFVDGPDAWRGLGLQANYTLVDSVTPDRRLGQEVPLQNLSRHSLNLIGSYERGPWRARLAWNWRSRFLSGTAGVVGLGTLPIYTRPYGWLDGAIGWHLTDRVSITLEGGNLLGTLRRTDYGAATRPQGAWVNDRQWALGLSVRL